VDGEEKESHTDGNGFGRMERASAVVVHCTNNMINTSQRDGHAMEGALVHTFRLLVASRVGP